MRSFVGFGKDVAESLHAVTPAGLELVEQAVDAAHGVDPPPHDPLSASLVLGDEVGPLEDGDVLLHGGETHRVTPSQVGHGVLALQHQPDDVPACRIGERMEQEVCSLRFRRSPLIYNHAVVRYPLRSQERQG
jgi:hypothetical protein